MSKAATTATVEASLIAVASIQLSCRVFLQTNILILILICQHVRAFQIHTHTAWSVSLCMLYQLFKKCKTIGCCTLLLVVRPQIYNCNLGILSVTMPPYLITVVCCCLLFSSLTRSYICKSSFVCRNALVDYISVRCHMHFAA